MTAKTSRTASYGILTALLGALLLASGLSGVAWAGEPGTLKLMVTDCFDTPLDGAYVEVEIHRPGYGTVTTDADYTDDGYVAFDFSDLEDGDQARVTVTPSGMNESSHIYTWASGYADKPGLWDIDTIIDGCEDTWYDKDENIIQCRCG